ncbi:MAG: sugar ABC transporter permease [Clostridiaceae bacterium]|nr:sugar ABC transporter permease [Clostridiaceae bacterium]
MKNKSKTSSLRSKRGNYGYVFIAPLLFGLVFMFGIPMVQSLIFSFNRIDLSADGYRQTFIGFKNYYNALFVEAEYREKVVQSILDSILNVPLIIFFSFFIANILNQKFVGRSFARVIMLLPLAMASPALSNFNSSDMMQGAMSAAQGASGVDLAVFESANFGSILISFGMPEVITDYLMQAADRIYEIINLSGIQILLFLAALQSVPRSTYEAAQVEGASGWEMYWKITFPMILPMVFMTFIYTVIDSFTASTNQTLKLVQDTAFSNINFGLSAAMSWIYFIVIILLLSISVLLLRKSVRENS